jgi:hypothetical protein
LVTVKLRLTVTVAERGVKLVDVIEVARPAVELVSMQLSSVLSLRDSRGGDAE